jgi:pimeloyl-ACP methyl ester carboxylesterase
MLFKTKDGIFLHGRLAGRGNILVIYAPGAGSSAIDAEKWCEPLEDIYGYSTFSYDLRGFGSSEGSKFDFENQVNDILDVIDAAIAKMKKQGEKPKKVILIGHSLGALACLIAGVKHPKVDAVFAISALYSIEDYLEDKEKIETDNSLYSIGKKIIDTLKKTLTPPWWFKKFIRLMSEMSEDKTALMPKYHLTEELMKKVYIIHGLNDEYIPYEKSGKKIIERFNLSRDRYLLVDTGHSFDGKIDEVLEWINSKIANKKSYKFHIF